MIQKTVLTILTSCVYKVKCEIFVVERQVKHSTKTYLNGVPKIPFSVIQSDGKIKESARGDGRGVQISLRYIKKYGIKQSKKEPEAV